MLALATHDNRKGIKKRHFHGIEWVIKAEQLIKARENFAALHVKQDEGKWSIELPLLISYCISWSEAISCLSSDTSVASIFCVRIQLARSSLIEHLITQDIQSIFKENELHFFLIKLCDNYFRCNIMLSCCVVAVS